MKYKIEIKPKAEKQLKKIDKIHRLHIIKWISKNLVDCTNPYTHGKALKGNLGEYWRYRVGNYRLIAEINNEKITICIVSIGHRKEIYD